QVLDPSSRLAWLRVRVQLFGEVVLEGVHGDPHRLDARERQVHLPRHAVRRLHDLVPLADVQVEAIEPRPSEPRLHAEPIPALRRPRQLTTSGWKADREREKVAQVYSGRLLQLLQQLLLRRRWDAQVQIQRGTRPPSRATPERVPALEHPPLVTAVEQPSQEALERHPLLKASDRNPVATRPVPQAGHQGMPKGGRGRVPHTSPRLTNSSPATPGSLRSCSRSALRRTRPRSSAWRPATSTCSGLS